MDVLNLKQIRVVNQLFVGALRNNSSFVHDNYFISQMYEVNGMSH